MTGQKVEGTLLFQNGKLNFYFLIFIYSNFTGSSDRLLCHCSIMIA